MFKTELKYYNQNWLDKYENINVKIFSKQGLIQKVVEELYLIQWDDDFIVKLDDGYYYGCRADGEYVYEIFEDGDQRCLNPRSVGYIDDSSEEVWYPCDDCSDMFIE